ncbi:hypothetical protein HDU96_005621 [Phlyctochytrium bullatum]|nr:hypothetical protein HDU96_005621 [Phlyctochytrium bullatum]
MANPPPPTSPPFTAMPATSSSTSTTSPSTPSIPSISTTSAEPAPTTITDLKAGQALNAGDLADVIRRMRELEVMMDRHFEAYEEALRTQPAPVQQMYATRFNTVQQEYTNLSMHAAQLRAHKVKLREDEDAIRRSLQPEARMQARRPSAGPQPASQGVTPQLDPRGPIPTSSRGSRLTNLTSDSTLAASSTGSNDSNRTLA